MAIEITDSRYGKSKKTLHDIILLILAKEFPLTIGEISKRIKKNFKIKLTFQAIRKSILILKERKILEEKEKKYSIKKSYILETRQFSDQLLRNYYLGEKNKALPTWYPEEKYTEYIFKNLLQADKFWGEIVLDWARNLKENDEKEFYFHGPHCWYPFGHLGTENDFLRELNEHGVKCYYLVDSNTRLDKWIKSFYEDCHAKYITINNNQIKSALGIFGNFIIQFDYTDSIFKELDDIFKKTNNIEDISLSRIALLLKKESKVNLTVTNNKMIAQKLKNELKVNFRK